MLDSIYWYHTYLPAIAEHIMSKERKRQEQEAPTQIIAFEIFSNTRRVAIYRTTAPMV